MAQGPIWEVAFTPISVPSLLSDSGASFPTSFLLTDKDGYCEAVRQGSGNNDVCSSQARPDLARDVQETTYGAYVRLDLDGEFNEFPWSANLGLRYVETDTSASGPSVELIRIDPVDADGATSGLDYVTSERQIVEKKNSYSNLLPSLNAKVSLSDNVDLRAAVAKVIT